MFDLIARTIGDEEEGNQSGALDEMSRMRIDGNAPIFEGRYDATIMKTTLCTCGVDDGGG